MQSRIVFVSYDFSFRAFRPSGQLSLPCCVALHKGKCCDRIRNGYSAPSISNYSYLFRFMGWNSKLSDSEIPCLLNLIAQVKVSSDWLLISGMVAVYNTFGGAETSRSERQSSNYFLVLTAACAVFVVAAVLVAGKLRLKDVAYRCQ